MSPDLAFQSVDRADTEADRLRHLDDADPLGQLQASALNLLWLLTFHTRAAQPCPNDACLALELAVAGEFALDDAETRPDSLPDHRALELGEGTRDLEQELAVGRGGVDVLLIQVKVDAHLLEVIDRAEQVDK